MKLLVTIATIFTLTNSALAQELTYITEFDTTEYLDKQINDIVRLDDNTALILFYEQKMLWRSDGSTAGSLLLHNWEGEISEFSNFNCTLVGVVNGRAVMLVSGKTTGRELWVTDGTVSGTHLLIDFVPGNTGLDKDGSETDKFVVLENACYLVGSKDGMWNILKTDGTVAGTEIFVKDIAIGDVTAPGLFFLGNDFYLLKDEFIYRINKDTKIISQIPATPFSYMADIEQLSDSTLIFAADDNFYGAVCKLNLNTHQIEILHDTDHEFESWNEGHYSKIFTKFNNKYYFSQEKDFYTHIIYSTDGTKSGTLSLTDFTFPTRVFYELGEKLWFTNRDDYHSIFSIDKNDNVKKVLTSTILSKSELKSFVLMDNNKFFVSWAPNSWNTQPYIFDPVNTTITNISNLNPSGSSPYLFTKIRDNYYFFFAYDADYSGSLYSLKLNSTSTNSGIVNPLNVINNITNTNWAFVYNNFTTKVNYKLVDVLGYTKGLGKIESEHFHIDASALFPGMYFLTIESNNNQSIKLIKQ